MKPNHTEFYSAAFFYQLAFSYREFSKECDFLSEVYKEVTGKSPQSFLELAAGPADHALEMSRREIRTTALDLSAPMAEYALKEAKSRDLVMEYEVADMTNFKLEKKFDLAYNPIDSISYILDHKKLISHLRSVGDALETGGVYIIEAQHPKDIFSLEASTENDWEMEKGEYKVQIEFGTKEDILNPLTQCMGTTVKLKGYKNGELVCDIQEKSEGRAWSYQDILAAMDYAGGFRLARSYGDFKREFPLEHPDAWRMILALEKI